MPAHGLAPAFGGSLLAAAGAAKAQTPGANPNVAAPFGPPVQDKRIYVHGLLDQFEARIGTENSFRWDGQAWGGTDTNRLWVKSEGPVTNSRVRHCSHQLLYDPSVRAYFELQGA